MNKDKINVILLLFIILVAVSFSYLLFTSGTTNKMNANLNKVSGSFDKDNNIGSYPIITMLINSSGEKLINKDVAITVLARSNYNINKIYYSFDKEKWFDNAYDFSYGKEAKFKLVFNKNTNGTLYIKVENEKGFQSYTKETKILIDKEKPILKLKNNYLIASDNYGLSNVQFSNDKDNWIDETILKEKKSISLNIDEIKYKYVRVVDKAGNISEIKVIEN